MNEAEKLLEATIDEISPLLEKDPNGDKFPGLWRIHAEISQYFDKVQA